MNTKMCVFSCTRTMTADFTRKWFVVYSENSSMCVYSITGYIYNCKANDIRTLHQVGLSRQDIACISCILSGTIIIRPRAIFFSSTLTVWKPENLNVDPEIRKCDLKTWDSCLNPEIRQDWILNNFICQTIKCIYKECIIIISSKLRKNHEFCWFVLLSFRNDLKNPQISFFF